jgi:hypothetical protein
MGQIQKILVVSYSQTGQLNEITENFINTLQNVEIDKFVYSPVVPFPFPWTSEVFFDSMPESVDEIPVPLKDINYTYKQYDLVIFAYQPWFLSPSIPASSLLQNEEFLSRIKNTPVITLIGTRNMWLNSQESVKLRIINAGGRIIGNIPFIDRAQNQLSAITILHWMLTGKKTKKYNIFPKPGVSDEDILSAADYGKILNDAIQNNNLDGIQKKFLKVGRISIPTEILFIEGKAKRLFKIWTYLISKFGTTPIRRKWLVQAFKYYLIIALFVVAPVVVTFYQIFIAPFMFKAINKKKQIFLQ